MLVCGVVEKKSFCWQNVTLSLLAHPRRKIFKSIRLAWSIPSFSFFSSLPKFASSISTIAATTDTIITGITITVNLCARVQLSWVSYLSSVTQWFCMGCDLSTKNGVLRIDYFFGELNKKLLCIGWKPQYTWKTKRLLLPPFFSVHANTPKLLLQCNYRFGTIRGIFFPNFPLYKHCCQCFCREFVK